MLKLRQILNTVRNQQLIISRRICDEQSSDGNKKSNGDDSSCSESSQYDERKYGHNLPTDNIKPCFETLSTMPTGVFRDTTGEVLGKGAAKSGTYKNPEYFSFHHMSFYDMHMYLRDYRFPCPKTGRKP